MYTNKMWLTSFKMLVFNEWESIRNRIYQNHQLVPFSKQSTSLVREKCNFSVKQKTKQSCLDEKQAETFVKVLLTPFELLYL
jgi:hypothetical protein